MKTFLPILSLFLLLSIKSNCQYNSVTIQPSLPTDIDTIKVIVNATFGSGPDTIYSDTTIISGNTYRLTGIYHFVVPGTLTTQTDTFYISPMACGNDTLITRFSEVNNFIQRIDTFLINVACVTTTLEEILNIKEATVYPNPFSDLLTIQTASQQQTCFTLTDYSGRVVMIDSFESIATVNTEMLKPGIYFYELKNKSVVDQYGKLIKY